MPLFRTYRTFELFFSFTYSAQWNIFEKEESVDFSNDAALLTAPAEERFLLPKMFLGTVYISDSLGLKTIYGSMQKYAGFFRLSQDSIFADKDKNAKKTVIISNFQQLDSVMERGDVKSLRRLYADLSGWQLDKSARAYQFDDAIMIAEIVPARSLSVSVPKEKISPQNALIIRAMIIKPVSDTVFVVSLVRYNSGIGVGDRLNTENFASVVSQQDMLHQTILQQVLYLVQSVKTIKA